MLHFYANGSKSSLCFSEWDRGSLSIGTCFMWQDFSLETSGTNTAGRASAYCSPLYRCHVQINQLHTFGCHWSQTPHPPPPSLSLKSYGIAGAQWLVCRPPSLSFFCLTSTCGWNLMLMSWACRLYVYPVAYDPRNAAQYWCREKSLDLKKQTFKLIGLCILNYLTSPGVV